ncbi:MAG: MerR family transcriptional regulator [Lachnospiraceae bacterium]|jgi:DNA-binding transcriptional MerR regulator|nr:MerR family transcriptional regulator [Lachnospiraceae bacterium]
MSETHYLISDASKKVDVESHVLRYWEEELEMSIPRNEMGHRYYTDFHIRLFKQIKELKEKGYQLKAIKAALSKSLDSEDEAVVPTDVLEEDMAAAIKECTDKEESRLKNLDDRELTTLIAEERAEQFKVMLSQMIGQAIEENNEKLSQDISRLVNDKVIKEMDYLMRVADERDEERFRQLDETLRLYQREGKGRAEAAAAKLPFFPFMLSRKKKPGKKQ